MEPIEQYFVLRCTRGFKLLSLWMKPYSATIQMKVIEQQFLLVLFVMLCQMVLAFEPVDETLKCDHSKESY